MEKWGKTFRLSKVGATSLFPILMVLIGEIFDLSGKEVVEGLISLPYNKKGISVDPYKENYK